MAVLGRIRSLGPVALISVIGLALFAFVFSTGSGTVTDVFKADEFNQSRVAIVNGIEMDRTDFMNKVDNIEQQNRGSRSSIQAMNSVWNTELKKLVLQSEYDKLGLNVEREMMRDFLKSNLLAFEDFQNENGEFDESRLNQFISNLKEISPEAIDLQGSLVNYDSWNNFEENINLSIYTSIKVGTAITMDATSGIVTATSFSGDGGNLTNVGAAQSTRILQVWLFGGG